MATKHRKLIAIIAVFLIPYLIALTLSQVNYTGPLQNKGQWVSEQASLDSLLPYTIDNDFSWHILIICENCDELGQITSVIQTLGPKSNLATLHHLSPNDISDSWQDLDPDKIYLATPQKELLLSYNRSQVMDLMNDLKRLVKPVEKRS